MSDRPSDLPRWADLADADDTIEPTSGRKDDGFDSAQRPPSQYLNWLLNTIYNWVLWIQVGVWQRSSLTDNTPVKATSDRNGRHRHYLGPEGYWMGPAIQHTHVWTPVDGGTDLITGSGTASCAPHARASGDVNTQTRIMPPTGTAPASGAPRMRMRVLNAAVSQGITIDNEAAGFADQPIGNLDDTIAVVETRVYTDTIGTSETKIFVGFHDQASAAPANVDDPALGNIFAMFRRSGQSGSEDTNWFAIVGNGSGTPTVVDSTVAIVADTWFTLRVELHGANSPVGVDNTTAPVARFFVDGAEVAEITTGDVPKGVAATTLGLFIRHQATATGPGADVDMVASMSKLAWNEVLDADVPA